MSWIQNILRNNRSSRRSLWRTVSTGRSHKYKVVSYPKASSARRHWSMRYFTKYMRKAAEDPPLPLLAPSIVPVFFKSEDRPPQNSSSHLVQKVLSCSKRISRLTVAVPSFGRYASARSLRTCLRGISSVMSAREISSPFLDVSFPFWDFSSPFLDDPSPSWDSTSFVSITTSLISQL